MDFGIFAVFLAVVSSVQPAICGKYEVAMVLPKDGRHGLDLLGISLWITIAISVSCLAAVVVMGNPLLRLLNAENLGRGVFLLPLALLFTGAMTAMNYFANRHDDYAGIARGQLLNASGIALLSIGLGLLGAGFWGLLAGWLVGSILATTFLLHRYRTMLSRRVLIWSEAKTQLLKRYRSYPIYNASTGLLDGIREGMPVFFLTRYFVGSIVGYYSLVLRVANFPLSFVASAVSQVNLKKVADLVSERRDVRPYLVRVTIGLLLFVLIPTVLVIMYAPGIVAFVFGEEWREAGMYMQILMPAIAVRFVASTLSTTLGATENNDLGALWKIVAFLLTVGVLAVYAPRGDVLTLLKAIVVADIALNTYYYWLIWKAATNPRNRPLAPKSTHAETR